MKIGKLNMNDSLLLVVDLQERLMPVIYENSKIFHQVNMLIKGMKILNVPTIVTEQYPKGLGNTCKEIELHESAKVIEKITFSCCLTSEIQQLLTTKKQVVLCGVEAHICVLKTALDLLEKNIEVHVVADAVSSRTIDNKMIALERMKQAGAFIVSTEMVLFQYLDTAGTDSFKAISKLIK